MNRPSLNFGVHSYQDEQRQRLVLVRVVRMVFVVLILAVTLLNILKVETNVSGRREIELAIGWYIPVAVALALSALVLAIDYLTPNKKISTISAVFFGLLAGMLATYALGFIIDLLAATYDIGQSAIISAIKVLFGISLCYLGVTTVLHTQDEFRLVIPYVEFAKEIRGPKPLLLDSSALIDARVVDLAATGIVQAPLVIPHFVIAELQLLADSGDRMRRVKGRRGLEVIGKLQRTGVLDVTVDESPVSGKAVDQMLVELARRMPGTIVTTDVALARIAQIQGVTVLNLHDVANALKPALIPGEHVSIRLIKEGEQSGQGVGYLEDGTMIVVENASDRIGAEVHAEVTSSLQTSAGRLIFARLAAAAPEEPTAETAARPHSAPQTPPLPQAAPVAQAAAVAGGVEPGGELSGAAAGGEPAPVAAAGPAPAPGSKPARTPFPPKPPARSITGRNPRR